MDNAAWISHGHFNPGGQLTAEGNTAQDYKPDEDSPKFKLANALNAKMVRTAIISLVKYPCAAHLFPQSEKNKYFFQNYNIYLTAVFYRHTSAGNPRFSLIVKNQADEII